MSAMSDLAVSLADGRCTYDTGSMYGCAPACDAPAEWSVSYRNGSSGPHTAIVCTVHLPATRGRVFPGLERVERLESARVTDADGWPLGVHGPYGRPWLATPELIAAHWPGAR